MQVTIFGSSERNYSIDRYARELSRNFPAGCDARLVEFAAAANPLLRQYDRYRRYPRYAAERQGDGNIIASEGQAYLLAALPPHKTLCVCHDVHPLLMTGKKTIAQRLYIRRYRWSLGFLPRARFVVAISESTRSDLLRGVPGLRPEQVVAVPNGLETAWKRVESGEALNRLRQQHRLENKRVLLHVGNDVWYKNFPAVLQTLERLSDPDLVLVHIGSVTPRSAELAGRLRLGERVRMLNNLADEELRAFYSLAEALVFPSLHEGFGWPPLEAMACACPVITSARASLPQVCGEAARYIDPESPDDIASAVRELLADAEARRHLVERGLEQAKKFSWRSTADRLLELLRR